MNSECFILNEGTNLINYLSINENDVKIINKRLF